MTEERFRRWSVTGIVVLANILLPSGPGGRPWNWLFSHAPEILLTFWLIVIVIGFVTAFVRRTINLVSSYVRELRDD